MVYPYSNLGPPKQSEFSFELFARVYDRYIKKKTDITESFSAKIFFDKFVTEYTVLNSITI